MNKQDWTYKKLGEVATFSRGLTYSKSDVVLESSNKVLRSNNIDLATHSLNFDDIVCLKESFKIPSDKMLQPNDIFICMSNGSTQHLGKVAFVEKKTDYAFGGFMGAIHPNISDIYPKYAYYYCLSSEYRSSLSSVLNGININNIKWSDLSKFLIPVPPIGEQERIVAELDLLQGIIEKKKEQLKAYDQLAQSIFYTMFGDPIGNPKGWETKKLKDLCDKITDGTHNSPINTEIGDYKYITAKNIKKDGITLNNITYVSADIHKAIYERCNPEYGDVLYIKDGITTGIATINTLNEEFSLLSSVALLKPKGCLMNYYLKAVLNMPSQYANIRESMGGAAITRLTITKINEIRIPVPPLPLQEEFAEKVEAIERQKALVQQSIEETQTMFDYTMDKYFG